MLSVPACLCNSNACLASEIMLLASLLAAPSTPKPTWTPASSDLRTGQIPAQVGSICAPHEATAVPFLSNNAVKGSHQHQYSQHLCSLQTTVVPTTAVAKLIISSLTPAVQEARRHDIKLASCRVQQNHAHKQYDCITALPDARRKLEQGQCAMPMPASANCFISSSFSITQWANQQSSRSHSTMLM